ncbi:MAG: filamentous hemagglutinin N-terminal domain-containing protein [Gammaproteobacteria bacterium]|nr:filamentous hemagglutinin N-terminal domain-containing protein [Gammaproteobacteria bacterium]
MYQQNPLESVNLLTCGKAQLFLLLGLLGFYAQAAAEVTLDGSLGHREKLKGPNYQIKAGMGQQQGGNLFHSFSSFNLEAGEAAVFYGPENVDNIISRVTGGQASWIDGWIYSAVPKANLYFINRAGVLLGPNAWLTIGGSVHFTTADYLRFSGEHEEKFYAMAGKGSSFSSAPPSAFGFLEPPYGEISKTGGFLSVSEGKTFSLTGGDISLAEGQKNVRFLDTEKNTGYRGTTSSHIHAPGGTVNLVSVASAGEEIPVNMSAESVSAKKFGTIRLTDSTSATENLQKGKRAYGNLNVSGAGGGRIYIHGGKIFLSNGYVFADTLGIENGNGIDINATEELVLNQGARITTQVAPKVRDPVFLAENKTGRFFVARERSDGKAPRVTGQGGTITITAPSILIEDGSQVNSNASPATLGKAGSIHMEADKLEISGYYAGSTDLSSGLLSNTGSAGDGGKITVKAKTLLVNNFGVIRADTVGSGDAGHISIEADRLLLQSGGQIKVSAGGAQAIGHDTGHSGSLTINAAESIQITGYGSSLHGNTFTAGKGGTVEITAPSLEITDQGTIETATRGEGQGGNIELRVDTLKIDSEGIITVDTSTGTGTAGNLKITAAESITLAERNPQAQANISSRSQGAGDAGKIELKTALLKLRQGGRISSDAEAEGKGGDIAVQADEIHIFGANSGISSKTIQTAEGGTLTLNAKDKLRITDAGHINAASEMNSEAAGNAGDIVIHAGMITLENGQVTTKAVKARGGNIQLNAQGRMKLFHSQITANAGGEDIQDSGGNVTLQTPEYILLQNGRIVANAKGGNGGNITIDNARGVLGSQTVYMDVSSEMRIDGKIIFNAPAPDFSQLEIAPDTPLSDKLVHSHCTIDMDASETSSMISVGRGGVSADILEWF